MDRWRCLDERVLHESVRTTVLRTYETAGGERQELPIVVQPPGVAVLALTEDDRAVLVRQYRPGPDRVLADLPAGFVDDGEDPVDAARRELREETGYEAGELEVVGRTTPDAYSTEVRFVAVARGCRRAGGTDTDPAEDTEVTTVPLAELRRLLRSDELTTVDVAYLALDALGALGAADPERR